MLDYKELSSKFTEILSSFSSNDLKEWIKFDAQREELERLTHGEKVMIVFDDFSVSRLYDAKEEISISEGQNNYQYAMAA